MPFSFFLKLLLLEISNNIDQKSVTAKEFEIMKAFCAPNDLNSIHMQLFSSPCVVSFISLIDITVFKQTVHLIE